MRKSVKIGAALLVLTALGAMAFVARESLRGRNASRLLYTRLVKTQDILDTSSNALSALNDSEIREQNYILTGETTYSEAYAEDVRTWQDESGSLELLATKDPASPLVQDFTKAGTRTLDELALIISTYEKDGREAALNRIRKGSGIVYLDQARNIAVKIREVDGGRLNTGNQVLVDNPLRIIRDIALGAAVLFCLTLCGLLILIATVRADQRRATRNSPPVITFS